ncbi:hypothetical protein [Oligosphaera ethanolica]|uniref:Uncharacterized protein n=1 Tax=Oligosphaera ethanolica TaxID=760260 RepID=A0AAE3VK41_9BACT|nr:hypothetical protein [Oligosphaera ethanolica]MDQ0291786.1 hypothetical protein [Oligosphaera ethanolica]
MVEQVPWIPLNEEHRVHRSVHPGGESTGDKLQDTHGQSPPSHSALISADLCGSGFHRSPYILSVRRRGHYSTG